MANKNDWLKQLKSGDPVVVYHSIYGSRRSYVKSSVERITPSGLLIVNGDYFMPKDGRRRGKEEWEYTCLLNYNDPEVKEKLLKYNRVKYVSNLCDRLQNVTPTYDQARQIAQIMGWSEEGLRGE